MNKRTKIVATLGPASSRPEILSDMMEAGMDVARINASHGTQDENRAKIEMVRSISEKARVIKAVLLDLQGPKTRIGKIAGNELRLGENDVVMFTQKESSGENGTISLPHHEFFRDMDIGDKLFLDDGDIELTVDSNNSGKLVAHTQLPCTLKSHKGIASPKVRLMGSVLTEKDRDDVSFYAPLQPDYIALSFVRTAHDVQELRLKLEGLGYSAIKIIAKIEKFEAWENLQQIIETADGIMIARGDMGIEFPLEKLPFMQQSIIERCNIKGKVVITATQMLKSMEHNPHPSRAEVNDVATAALQGTDATMLSGETASGLYPVESVRMMSRILQETESNTLHTRLSHLDQIQIIGSPEEKIRQAVSHIAYEYCRKVEVKAIAVWTESGIAARRIAQQRIKIPTVCLTPNPTTLTQMALIWGIDPVLVTATDAAEERLKVVVKNILEQRCAKPGDTIMIIGGHPTMAGQTQQIFFHIIQK